MVERDNSQDKSGFEEGNPGSLDNMYNNENPYNSENVQVYP